MRRIQTQMYPHLLLHLFIFLWVPRWHKNFTLTMGLEDRFTITHLFTVRCQCHRTIDIYSFLTRLQVLHSCTCVLKANTNRIIRCVDEVFFSVSSDNKTLIILLFVLSWGAFRCSQCAGITTPAATFTLLEKFRLENRDGVAGQGREGFRFLHT